MTFLPRMYQRDGTPYSSGDEGLLEWVRDFGTDNIVRQDKLSDGSFISTVWIGLDLDTFNMVRGRAHQPLIFETITWDARDEIVEMRRYPTENDAIIGHVEAVDRQQAKVSHGNT